MGRWDTNEYQGDQEVRMHYHVTAIKLSKIIKTFYRVFRTKATQMSTEVLQVRCVCGVVSCFSCVCPCECMEVAQQAPLSKGFSRQENWSGLPCPSPGDLPNPRIETVSLKSPALASEFFTTRVTWSESESCSVMYDSLWPHGLYSMEFSRGEYWSGEPFPSPGDLPNPGIKPRSSSLERDSLPAEPQAAEPPEKPKNTGMGSLSFLQWIFLT